jgi:hypothetical protein
MVESEPLVVGAAVEGAEPGSGPGARPLFRPTCRSLFASPSRTAEGLRPTNHQQSTSTTRPGMGVIENVHSTDVEFIIDETSPLVCTSMTIQP